MRALVLAFAVSAAACHGGQSGTENLVGSCQDGREVRVSPGDTFRELDFTPAEALAVFGGLRAGAFTAAGVAAPAALELSYEGAPIRAIPQRFKDGLLDLGSGVECPSRYAIPVRASLRSEDGALAEELELDLVVHGLDAASLAFALPLAAVAGSARPRELDPNDFDAIELTGSGAAGERFNLSSGWRIQLLFTGRRPLGGGLEQEILGVFTEEP
jgi:hypothetical protein